MPDFWLPDVSDYTGPSLTPQMVRAAEEALGYKLPGSYLQLLGIMNGGRPRRRCLPMSVRTSWAEDHICIEYLLGIGYDNGIDGKFGSRYMIDEWACPEVGILIADTPSAGHDWIALDYRECGPAGEPSVVHIELESETPVVTPAAPDFATFAQALVDCGQYNA